MSQSKDIATIKHIKEDVRGSYAVLYKDYYRMIGHLVMNNSGTAEDASDIFQDTVIVLFEMIQKKSFKLDCALSTLLYSIARNIWYKQLRKKDTAYGWDDFEKYIDLESEEDMDDMLAKEDQIVMMEAQINAMGDPCKTILIHFYYLKKKMKEIADALKYKSADHAKTQKYKCLQRLKKMVLR